MKLYHSPIMDLCNGKIIISYGISMRPTSDLVMRPLEEILEIIKDSKYRTTNHSDQGWHYKHKSFLFKLKENKIFQSMS